MTFGNIIIVFGVVIMSSFGARLKKLRENENLSQTELAKRLNLSQSVIAYYESNKKQPSQDTLSKMADYFNVTVDYLLGRNNKPDSVGEIQGFIKELGIDEVGFFDIDQWRNLSAEDIEEIKRHFEWIAHKAKERNKNK